MSVRAWSLFLVCRRGSGRASKTAASGIGIGTPSRDKGRPPHLHERGGERTMRV
jgi:hypothetical protein